MQANEDPMRQEREREGGRVEGWDTKAAEHKVVGH